MSLIAQISGLNTIKQEDFKVIVQILFDSFSLKKKNNEELHLEKKEELVEYFSVFLEKYLQADFVTSTKTRLAIIDLIDKLNAQKEVIELVKAGLNESDIKMASERLARKSQSTFSSNTETKIVK